MFQSAMASKEGHDEPLLRLVGGWKIAVVTLDLTVKKIVSRRISKSTKDSKYE